MIENRYFEKANEKRFKWQTSHPYVSLKEKELLQNLEIHRNDKKMVILEVGCGEGANIYNLQKMGYKANYIGIDNSVNKIEFAKQYVSRAEFIHGNALNLPFKKKFFDLVFCRDLLHHLCGQDRDKAIDEMTRVCKNSGRIAIIEGNGRKLTNLLFGLLVPDEKGMIETSPANLLNNIVKNGKLYISNFINTEPSNLFRIIYHYSINKNLYNNRFINMILSVVSSVSKKLIRKNKWAYSILIAKF